MPIARIVVLGAFVVSCAGDRTSPGCEANSECAAGEVCSSGQCVALCSSSSQCDAGEICSANGICVPSTGDAPVILGIDGSASADSEPTHAPHRINDRLIISGANLSSASVSITGTEPLTNTYMLAECEPGTDELKTVSLPAALQDDLAGHDGGEFVLTVANQAGQCTAEVWLLRGEVADLTPPVTIGAVTITGSGLQVAGTVDATNYTVGGSPLNGSPWTQNGGDISYDAGHVGVGTDATDANLTVHGTFSAQLSGIVSTTAGSQTVNGSGTQFTTELRVGDAIAIGGETFTVASIADNATLLLDAAASAGVSDAPAYTDSALLAVADGNGVSKVRVDKSGRIGIGTASPAAPLHLRGTAGGDQINLEQSSPQIKFTDTDEDDYWLHVNGGRLYVLWDEGDDGDWDAPYPVYFQGRDAYFGGNVNVGGSLNARLTCQTILTTTTTTSTHTVGCPAGYIATGSGWEPGTNWDTSASHRVINGTDSTGCSFFIGGMNANWRTSCTCCRVVTD